MLRALGRVGRGRLEFVSGRDEPDVLALSINAVPRLRSELQGRHGHRSRKETHDGPLQHRGSWLFSANKQRLVLSVSDPTENIVNVFRFDVDICFNRWLKFRHGLRVCFACSSIPFSSAHCSLAISRSSSASVAKCGASYCAMHMHKWREDKGVREQCLRVHSLASRVWCVCKSTLLCWSMGVGGGEVARGRAALRTLAEFDVNLLPCWTGFFT